MIKQSITLIIIVLFSVSCQDEFPSLVKEYTIKWEADLADQYPPGQFPSHSLSSGRIMVTDNEIFVSSAFENTSGGFDGIVTKLDLHGQFVKDIVLTNNGIPQITLDINNNLAILFSDVLTTYDRDFNVIGRQTFDFGAGYQHTLAFGKSTIYKHRHVNGQQMITQYDLHGSVNWETPYTLIGCGGQTISVLFKSEDLTIVAENYPDSLKIAHINSNSGKKHWSKLLMKQETLPDASYVHGVWTGGRLVLLSQVDSGRKLMTYYVGSGAKAKIVEVEFPMGSYLSKSIPTKDDGLLVGIGSSFQNDPANFRLVKLDRNGNAGWMGTFTQLGYDQLADLTEMPDGTIIVLTTKGYVQALTPTPK